ncbi:MAG TPA: double zinc ribbon domain-containing protein [Steroidobacteraceae bacterium]
MLDRASRGLLPARCILCAGAGRGPAHDLCADCEVDLPWLSVACSRCGLPVDDATLRGTTPGCVRCRDRALPYRRCHACFRYEFPLSELVHGLKYDGALANARVLGTLLAGSLARQPVHREVELLVPMPLHTSRLVARGFNQSHEIARFTAVALGWNSTDERCIAGARPCRRLGWPARPGRPTSEARLRRSNRASSAVPSRCSTTS